ncbi:unnamed protein product [Brachionus calyciflorus]|uniref:Uncharacterized protein n=1 Tax=Brachionus calyciflorus TaxID=104777 RepID=A0A813VZF2_9BILA|nr:unnamed protein product [Brachionus calyciflorus]
MKIFCSASATSINAKHFNTKSSSQETIFKSIRILSRYFIVPKSLGTSSSYSTCVSLVFPFKLWEKFRFGLGNYASLLFALSVFLGSLTSALSGGIMFGFHDLIRYFLT